MDQFAKDKDLFPGVDGDVRYAVFLKNDRSDVSNFGVLRLRAASTSIEKTENWWGANGPLVVGGGGGPNTSVVSLLVEEVQVSIRRR